MNTIASPQRAGSIAEARLRAKGFDRRTARAQHRHVRLWRAPAAFDPERFLPGAPPVDRFAYLPFGAGPRICIGAHFALLEATLVLAALVRRFRIELADPRPAVPVAVVTTQPGHAPPFRIARRT